VFTSSRTAGTDQVAHHQTRDTRQFQEQGAYWTKRSTGSAPNWATWWGSPRWARACTARDLGSWRSDRNLRSVAAAGTAQARICANLQDSLRRNVDSGTPVGTNFRRKARSSRKWV